MLVSGERTLDRAELVSLGGRAASGLISAGVKAGDAVALILRNDFPYFVMHEAARYGPFDMVPVNWHLNAAEIGYILEDCDARAVVIHEDLLQQELLPFIEDLTVIVVPTPVEIEQAYGRKNTGDAGATSFLPWKDWLQGCSRHEEPVLPFYPPLFYTSGSSGNPKAVLRDKLSAEEAQKIGQRTAFAWGFDKKVSCSVMTGPLYHSAPNGYANMVLQAGATLVLQARFDAEQLLQYIEQFKVSHLHMVPTMFVRLLALAAEVKEKYDLSSLVHVSHGAAPCPPDVKQQLIEWWGNVIYEYYAMTETGIITCCDSKQWLAHPGSVGCAAPGVSLEIRDKEGNPCKAGETGTICARHESTGHVNYRRQDRGNGELVQKGYLVTGDIGYLDEDGFLYISDRESDMVISGGVNIYPVEVEKVLINYKGVNDCCVLGVPDPEFGEKLVAFIEADDELEDGEIRSYLEDKIAAFKIPRVIQKVSKLPREDSGKIKKKKLKEAFIQQHKSA